MESAISKHSRFVQGEFLLSDEIEKYLQSIETHKHLNAFIFVDAEKVRQRAREIDQKRAAGAPLGALAGVVIALKDNLCIKDEPVTCASNILEKYVSPYDATVVQKILDADGLIIGKTNLDEFAMGSSTENSAFGPAHHPLKPDFVCGGSSGGSAVAVATGMADLALGSDTGGSVRQPAAFCGVVGLKPTYGRVSRFGLVAYASSLDQIGTFGRSVADAAMLLKVIAGVDPNDSTSANRPVPDYLSDISANGKAPLTIGIPGQFFQDGLDPEISKRISNIIDELKKRGFQTKPVDLPLTEYAIATYYIIATAEASSNLSRYDGVRYGHRSEKATDLESMYVHSRSEGFGTEVKRRIMLGTYVLSSGYYDAYYKKGMQVRRLIKAEYDKAFTEVDVLLTPTTPTTAFKIGEKTADPLQMYLSDIYTVTANLSGICAMSVPAGTDVSGMPIGVQIFANTFDETTLLTFGSQVEEIANDI